MPRGPLWKDARIHPLFSSHVFYVFVGVLLCVDMRLLVGLCVRVYACVGICHRDPVYVSTSRLLSCAEKILF